MTQKAGKSLKEKVALKNNLLKEALAELLGTFILIVSMASSPSLPCATLVAPKPSSATGAGNVAQKLKYTEIVVAACWVDTGLVGLVKT